MTIEILPSFKRALKQLAKKYPSVPDDFLRLLENLQEDPQQGEPLGKTVTKSVLTSLLKKRASAIIHALLRASK
jgi:mRNA-degrading endonuclease RelE of RelBE toxin-antitoxin system